MSAHAYSEDALAEQPAIELFAGLRWQTIGSVGSLPVLLDVAYSAVEKRR